ncbi:sensor histidine kinase [Propionibacterium freudenreichii]|uniref:sensor histidine kinase n=1 Tax=Propionibacterium freudenreichii TaxID=1744 RepID=UPI002550C05F|nr:sensor histidine kinase [Propionibacterium freudenreichii]MDK9301298.1 sensor histidine kinase [Propionibacterium freudenreichii]MDK9339642.1 sensor histidine kinase [Propionibacterium freudenreichii]MDK9648189.1 sensor histidine kinase [Propionibacterium freudenreichii]MDK9668091.1 sensor histidine kinase [Propionibacterium freudenreichii]
MMTTDGVSRGEAATPAGVGEAATPGAVGAAATPVTAAPPVLGWRWFEVGGGLISAGYVMTSAQGLAPRCLATVCVLVVAGLCLWLANTARPHFRLNAAAAWWLVVVNGLLVCAAVAAAPRAQIVLMVLVPAFFRVFDYWRSVLATAPVVAGLLGVSLVQSGPGVLAESLGAGVAVVVLSALFGRPIDLADAERKRNVALVSRLEQEQASVARLSREQAVRDERERLSRDIHDTLAQGFLSIITLGHAAQAELATAPAAAAHHLDLMIRSAEDNLAESRRMVAALSPAPLARASLADAVQRVVDGFTEQTGLAADVQLSGEPVPLPPQVQVVVLRVTQEALANVRRHAGARSVDVHMAYLPDRLRLRIVDDGHGFDPAHVAAGHGLRNMAERVGDVHGRYTLTSAPGAGTVVEVSLPMAAELAEPDDPPPGHRPPLQEQP